MCIPQLGGLARRWYNTIMAKMIALYKDGSVGFIETEGNHTVVVNGQPPTELLEPTAENMKKYFGDIDISTDAKNIVLA